MLVLTRCFGERLMIGKDIVITVLKGDGKKISIGIEAPKEIEVHREEIFHRLKQEKKAATM